MLRGRALCRAPRRARVWRPLATAAGQSSATSSAKAGASARMTDDRKAELFKRFLETKRKELGATKAAQSSARPPSSASGQSSSQAQRPSRPSSSGDDDLSAMFGKGGMDGLASMLGGGKGGQNPLADMMRGSGGKEMEQFASMMSKMGSPGGKGGMPDMASMMAAMGGAGGAGSMPDMESMMSALGGGGKGGKPDLASLLAGMGGAGGKGGMPDMASMMAAMGSAKSTGGGMEALGGAKQQAAPGRAGGKASLASPKLKVGPNSSPASVAAAMNDMAAQQFPQQSDADAMAELRRLNRNADKTIADMRRQLGDKGDPLATMATRAARGNDPTGMLGREDQYVKSPEEAMGDLYRTQAKEEALKAQKASQQQSSLKNVPKMPAELLEQVDRAARAKKSGLGERRRIDEDLDEEDEVSNEPRIPLMRPPLKGVAPHQLPARFGSNKLASSALKPAAKPKSNETLLEMPELPTPPPVTIAMSSEQRSKDEIRLAFRTKSGLASPTPDVAPQRVTRGDDILKARAMISSDMERLVAQAASDLKKSGETAQEEEEEEEEVEDVTGQPWVIRDEPLFLEEELDETDLAHKELDAVEAAVFAGKPLPGTEKDERNGVQKMEEKSDKEDVKTKASDENEDEDEDEGLFTDEDYERRAPKNAAEAEALAQLRARRNPEHIKRRRATVKKAAERLAKDLSPRDEQGRLRWADELDETNDIVQESIQLLQEDVEEGPTEALEAFAEHEFEGQLALVAAWAFDKKLPWTMMLYQKFYERFPDSLYPPRAVLAGVLLESQTKGDWEAAASLARMHLAGTFIAGEYDKYRTADIPAVLLKERLLREGIDRAGFALVQFYSKLGARTFAKSLMTYLATFPMSVDIKKVHQDFKAQMEDDLQRPDMLALDQKWEEFMRTGRHAKYLNNLAIRDGMVQTATRIKAHATRFEKEPGYKVDLRDIWLELWPGKPDEEETLRSLLDPLDDATADKLRQKAEEEELLKDI